MQVAMALNSLLAAPAFAAWAQGEPLDIARMIRSADGCRPRANVLYIAHLSDRERVFFVAAFLQALITWMRLQPGSSSLRALFYMDEIFGYFPPSANPPTKGPLLTLLKQARAFGLGTMLATQNPVDVDYKGLANAGTWFLGKLQTEQDRARLLDGLSGTTVDRGAVETALAGLPPRTFLMQNSRVPGLKRFTTRWALSYLRGPLTREEIKRLKSDAAAPVATQKAAEPSAGRPIRESPGAGVPEWFLQAPADGPLIPAIRARVRVRFPGSEGLEEDLVLPLAPDDRPGGLKWDQAVQVDKVSRETPSARPPERARFEDLPDAFRAASAFKTAGSGLENYLAARRTSTELRNRPLKLTSTSGEGREAFLERCRGEAKRRADAEARALKTKYEEKNRRLQTRVAKELRELELDKQDLAGRKVDELVNAGETLLGMFFGTRRRSISGIAGKRRMVSNTIAQVEKSQAEYEAALAELERLSQEAGAALEELDQRWAIAAEGIEQVAVKPLKSEVQVVEIGLLWMPK